jgi:hypothetical protein
MSLAGQNAERKGDTGIVGDTGIEGERGSDARQSVAMHFVVSQVITSGTIHTIFVMTPIDVSNVEATVTLTGPRYG